jgi:hypothetical protein
MIIMIQYKNTIKFGNRCIQYGFLSVGYLCMHGYLTKYEIKHANSGPQAL